MADYLEIQRPDEPFILDHFVGFLFDSAEHHIEKPKNVIFSDPSFELIQRQVLSLQHIVCLGLILGFEELL